MDCSVHEPSMEPVCSVALEHTSAKQRGTTLQTLDIDEGYWRASDTSRNIFACYNAVACRGGQTGVDTYCESGYTGPCALWIS